uniref:Uncharacterized protein n=1 Tax=Arundo donax TaxID=35708 RepID=A0A0A8YMP3_ARUDO
MTGTKRKTSIGTGSFHPGEDLTNCSNYLQLVEDPRMPVTKIHTILEHVLAHGKTGL